MRAPIRVVIFYTIFIYLLYRNLKHIEIIMIHIKIDFYRCYIYTKELE